MPFDGTGDQYGIIERLQILAELTRNKPRKSQQSFRTCLFAEAYLHPRLTELGIRKLALVDASAGFVPIGWTELAQFFGTCRFVTRDDLFGTAGKKAKLRVIEARLRALGVPDATPAIVRASSLMSVKAWEEG